MNERRMTLVKCTIQSLGILILLHGQLLPLHAQQMPCPNVLFIAVDDLNDWNTNPGARPEYHTLKETLAPWMPRTSRRSADSQ